MKHRARPQGGWEKAVHGICNITVPPPFSLCGAGHREHYLFPAAVPTDLLLPTQQAIHQSFHVVTDHLPHPILQWHIQAIDWRSASSRKLRTSCSLRRPREFSSRHTWTIHANPRQDAAEALDVVAGIADLLEGALDACDVVRARSGAVEAALIQAFAPQLVG